MKPSLTPFKKRTILVLCLIFFFESSCAHVARVKAPPSPKDTPKELFQYYQYPSIKKAPTITVLAEHETYIEKKVVFENIKDATGVEEPLILRYYEPRQDRPHPLILVTPILGKQYEIERAFATFFAEKGFACVIVRRKRLKLDPNKDLSQLEEYFRSSIVRLRFSLDWLRKQKRINPNAIGTFGVSFGGVLNTILAGIEPDIKCHIIALAGGELADVIMYSHENAIRDYREQFMKTRGIDEQTLRGELREAIFSEPMDFAHFVDTRKVFLFVAWFDLIIGRKHARKLAKALGYPKTYYVPLGHYTSSLVVPFVRVKAAQFFESHLKENP